MSEWQGQVHCLLRCAPCGHQSLAGQLLCKGQASLQAVGAALPLASDRDDLAAGWWLQRDSSSQATLAGFLTLHQGRG